jgi:hypothetical protein
LKPWESKNHRWFEGEGSTVSGVQTKLEPFLPLDASDTLTNNRQKWIKNEKITTRKVVKRVKNSKKNQTTKHYQS